MCMGICNAMQLNFHSESIVKALGVLFFQACNKVSKVYNGTISISGTLSRSKEVQCLEGLVCSGAGGGLMKGGSWNL